MNPRPSAAFTGLFLILSLSHDSGRVDGCSDGWASYSRSGGWRGGRGQLNTDILPHRQTCPVNPSDSCWASPHRTLTVWWSGGTLWNVSHGLICSNVCRDDAARSLQKHLCLTVSEWDELPSDDEDTLIKEDASKYVCLEASGWCLSGAKWPSWEFRCWGGIGVVFRHESHQWWRQEVDLLIHHFVVFLLKC